MRRTRGVALILALVIVALATIMATRIGARSALDQHRTAVLLAQEQGFELGLGAEAWAIETLRSDAERNPRQVTLDQAWAMPLPPLPIDGGELTGQLEDLQGRFNLNNLVNPDGTHNAFAAAWFGRLLARLELEPKWVALLTDWIDPDNVVDGMDGGEDALYTGLKPPYRPPNRPITTTTELLALPDFGPERFRRLAPYVSALPAGTPLNVCTAQGLVIATLAPSLAVFAQDPKALAQNRLKGCFPAKTDVLAAVQAMTPPQPANAPPPTYPPSALIAETSSFFRARTAVRIGTTELTLYSLLVRTPEGSSRVVKRSFGTE